MPKGKAAQSVELVGLKPPLLDDEYIIPKPHIQLAKLSEKLFPKSGRSRILSNKQ